MLLQPGQVLGDDLYRIDSFIARGGMAEVWRARHIPTGEARAIKVMLRRARRYPSLVKRFELEYDILRRLNHPHIMKVHDWGEVDVAGGRLPWFSMTYYGRSLGQCIEYIPIGDGIRYLLQVLEALQHAHSRNICHRDLKPVNILVDDAGHGVLSDFGIAKETDVDRNLTGQMIIGTAHYLSPEQCRGETITPRSDIYAFGVILYRLCTGRFPFEGDIEPVLVRQHLSDTPRPVRERNKAISEELAAIVERCLNKEPEARFGSARELARELRRVKEVAETPQEALRAGERILEGRYEVVSFAEEGGFAQVYRVRDRESGKLHALKLCLPLLAHDPEINKRFLQEVRIMRTLDHPNIVKVAAEGLHMVDRESLPFFIMEWFPGSLQTALGRSVDPEKAYQVVLDVLNALSYAHRFQGEGIVHRDLKPSNILIRSNGQGCLTDFGIAKISRGLSDVMARNATMTRAAIGTSHFMAPEQIRNESLDVRVDVYAAGIILYQLATGHRPFEAGTDEEVIAKQLYEEPTPPAQYNPQISRPLELLILKCLAKDREERFADAGEILYALESIRRQGRFFSTRATDWQTRLRRQRRVASRLARSPLPYLVLVGVIAGYVLGLGGSYAAHAWASGSLTSAFAESWAPRYEASLAPARRWRDTNRNIQGDRGSLDQWLGEKDPEIIENRTEIEFLSGKNHAELERLQLIHAEAHTEKDPNLFLYAKRRIEELLRAARPVLTAQDDRAGKGISVQSNQANADLQVALALRPAPSVEFAYRWRLTRPGQEQPIQDGESQQPRIALTSVPEGNYDFEARAVYKGFESEPIRLPVEVVLVTRVVEIESRGAGHDQHLAFANFDPDEFGDYEWYIQEKDGRVADPPAESRKADLRLAALPEGRWEITLRAYDTNPDLPDFYPSSPRTVVIDRTGPILSATAEIEGAAPQPVAPDARFILLPDDPELKLWLTADDKLSDRTQIQLSLIQRDGPPLTLGSAQYPIGWDVEREEYRFEAIDAHRNVSEQLVVRVTSVDHVSFATLGAAREAWMNLSQNWAKHGRTLELVDSGAIQEAVEVAEEKGRISREWLSRHVEDSEAFERLRGATDRLEAGIQNDDDFANGLAMLKDRFPREKAVLDEAAQDWARGEGGAGLTPVAAIQSVAPRLLPRFEAGDFQYATLTEQATDHYLELHPAAELDPSLKLRTFLSAEPIDDDFKRLGERLDAEAMIADRFEEYVENPTRPVYVVLQTMIENLSEEIGPLTGEPKLFEVPPAVAVDDDLAKLFERHATLIRDVHAGGDENPYLARSAAYLEADVRDPKPADLMREQAPNWGWLALHANEAGLIQRLRTESVTLDQYIQGDRKIEQAESKLKTRRWQRRHRNTLKQRLVTQWLDQRPAQDPEKWRDDVFEEYVKAHRSELLEPPKLTAKAVQIDQGAAILRVERAGLGEDLPGRPFAVDFGYISAGADEEPPAGQIRRAEFKDGQSQLALTKLKPGKYRLMARLVREPEGYRSAWSRPGIPFQVQAAPKVTPPPTVSPTASPTISPTASPNPDEPGERPESITEAEATAFAKQLERAVSQPDSKSIREAFRKLCVPSLKEVDSRFLLKLSDRTSQSRRFAFNIDRGQNRYENAVLSAVAGPTTLEVELTLNQSGAVSVETYELTLVRSEDRFLIEGDQLK